MQSVHFVNTQTQIVLVTITLTTSTVTLFQYSWFLHKNLPLIHRKNWKDTRDGCTLSTHSLSRCMLTEAATTPLLHKHEVRCLRFQMVCWQGQVSQSPSAKLYSDLTLRQTSWNHSLLTLFLFFSVRPCQLTTDVCQCNCTHTHTHKADEPCKSRIILWSWFSSTLVPAAMAPPLAPWQPGVTGSYKVCWIRKSEPVRNKRRITAPSLFSYGHIWSTQMCVRMSTLLNIFAANAV